MEEVKRFPRFDMSEPLRFCFYRCDEMHEGVLINYSATGLLFETDREIPKDTKVRVKIDGATAARRDVVCDVVRVSEGGGSGRYAVALKIIASTEKFAKSK